MLAAAVCSMLVGLRALRLRDGHRCRAGNSLGRSHVASGRSASLGCCPAWWGLGLLLGGIGALLAGFSFQAFGYELKARGREVCLLTSGWEVGFNLATVAALQLGLVGFAAAFAPGRRVFPALAASSAAVFAGLTAWGVYGPVRFLVSFELVVLFCAPGTLLCVGLALRQPRATRRPLLTSFGLLAGSAAAYYLFRLAGLTEELWEAGLWFSDNDVLHVGMILWLLHAGFKVLPVLRDGG